MALQWAVFFIAAVLVVIGTSLLWAAEDASLKSATDRGYRFTIFEFWLATFASAAALLSATAGWFPLKNTGVWIAIAAGTLFILVSSRGDISSTAQNGSIAIINYCRYTNEDTSTFNSKRCVGGGVLAYIGVFLAFIAGLPWSKPVFSGSRFVLLIIEFILLVIGVVVIWETDAAVVGASGYKLLVDDGFYSILVFFFAFLGVVLQINDLVVAAAFFAAYNYCRVFTSMFFVATGYPSQEDNIYAGYVILTFSNVFALIVALLGDSAGKSSKVGSNN